MREKTQCWIAVSNREESMARVLSRADFHEGAVFHAHRAAEAALTAIFAEHGWAHTSNRCADLLSLIEAHKFTPTTDVLRAAQALDEHSGKLDWERTGAEPARTCTANVASECLDAIKTIRSFVSTVLSK
jgi:HEPN domain-containing protein